MADTVGSENGKAKGGLSRLGQSEAVDLLKKELQGYLAAQAERMLAGAGRKLGETTGKLNDIAEGNSPGFAKMALEGGRKLAEGKGPLRAVLETGAGKAKEKIGEAFKGLFGGKSKRKRGGGSKPTVIIESLDVGVPVRTAYDQWTQYQDFSTFAKGVKSASRDDDITSSWNLKVLWSSRSWKGHTVEQVPDYKIQWTSEGAKDTTKGVITFHALGENLTRLLLVMEYYPSGFFEKTGNIWRAQGRRARLDFKNFDRFITLKGEAEDSWRGEIHDGEVVRTHEDAIAGEEEEEPGEEEKEPEEEEPEGGYEEVEEEEPEGAR
ncbi:SRPBCC family protein [Streptomyces sp. NPDC058451]|uniref:SRPBCC family protein n=1 Tax=Streptomyces sp. NPDC058451 TaxID=3346506 RepID=UPI00366876F6